MGQLNVAELNPMAAALNGVKAIVMLVKASAIVVVALCSGFRHLKRMRTVLKLLLIHIAVAN